MLDRIGIAIAMTPIACLRPSPRFSSLPGIRAAMGRPYRLGLTYLLLLSHSSIDFSL